MSAPRRSADNRAVQRIRKALRNERGATAVEYSVLVVLIAAVIVISVASLGGATNSNIDCAGKSWQNKTTACVNPSGTSTPSSSPSSSPNPSPTSGGGGNNAGGNGNGNGGVGNGNGNGNSH